MQAFCLVYSSMDCVMFERNPGRHNKVVERANRGQSEKHVTFRTERKERYQIDFGVLTLKTNSLWNTLRYFYTVVQCDARLWFHVLVCPHFLVSTQWLLKSPRESRLNFSCTESECDSIARVNAKQKGSKCIVEWYFITSSYNRHLLQS